MYTRSPNNQGVVRGERSKAKLCRLCSFPVNHIIGRSRHIRLGKGVVSWVFSRCFPNFSGSKLYV